MVLNLQLPRQIRIKFCHIIWSELLVIIGVDTNICAIIYLCNHALFRLYNKHGEHTFYSACVGRKGLFYDICAFACTLRIQFS